MQLQHVSLVVALVLCNVRACAAAALPLNLCDPAGTWFSTNDRGRHQPLTVIKNVAALPGCPDTQLVDQSYIASALHAWQNDSLCLYRNGRYGGLFEVLLLFCCCCCCCCRG